MPSTDIGAASGSNLGSNLGRNQGGNLGSNLGRNQGGNLGSNQGGNLGSDLGSSLEDLAYQTVGVNGQAVAQVNGRLCTEGQLGGDHQTQSSVIIRGNPRASEAIRGRRGNQWQSEAIRGHQRASPALAERRRHHGRHSDTYLWGRGDSAVVSACMPPWKALRYVLLLPSLGLPPPPPPPKSAGISAAPATPATALAEARGCPTGSRGRKATLRMPSRKSHLMRCAIGHQHAMRDAISSHQ